MKAFDDRSLGSGTNGPDDGIMLQSVTLDRGGRRIFDSFSLNLNERRIALIGDNGSGKSTLLRLLNGLLLPDIGCVLIGNRDTSSHSKELPAEIGFVFQNPDHQILFPTVGEELAFGLTERGFDKSEASRRVRQVLDAHGCGGWEDRAIHELSEGQKQLVCILAVIAPEPRIILLDEPFASLDLSTRIALGERLRLLPQRMIMASHDLELVADFDRVIWLDGGQVREDGRPGQVIDAYRASARERAHNKRGGPP